MKKKAPPPRACILIDSREQAPLRFNPNEFDTERASFPTGDYSIRGMTELVAIERKSGPDLAHCCGHDHERFMDQMARLEQYRHRFLVLEVTEPMIWAGCLGSSAIRPQSVMGSLLKVMTCHGTPVIFSPNARDAASKVEWIVRRLWSRYLDGAYERPGAAPDGDPGGETQFSTDSGGVGSRVEGDSSALHSARGSGNHQLRPLTKATPREHDSDNR